MPRKFDVDKEAIHAANIAGDKRYLSKVPCNNCDTPVPERYTGSKKCCNCTRSVTARWKKAMSPTQFKERKSEHNRAYREKQKDKLRMPTNERVRTITLAGTHWKKPIKED